MIHGLIHILEIVHKMEVFHLTIVKREHILGVYILYMVELLNNRENIVMQYIIIILLNLSQNFKN